MSTLTEEQKRRIEVNRQRALQLRAAKQLQQRQQNEESFTMQSVGVSAATKQPVILSPFPRPVVYFKVVNSVCRLISRTKFVVDVDQYHKGLIDVFKTVPCSIYDPIERKWNFPIREHSTLLKAVKGLKSEVRMTPLPDNVVKVFTNATLQREIPKVDLSPVDRTLIDDLYLFQKEGVWYHFGIGKQGRILLADDMGLGKTIQAIAICAYYKSEWPLLVIAPSSIRYAWQQSFLKWMPSIDPQSVIVINSGKDEIVAQSVLIISYELVAKNATLLLSMNFQVIIVDESHFLKSHSSSRTKAILPLLKNGRRVCLLSGTPALSRPSELYTQLTAICPNIFTSFRKFAERYCEAKMTRYGYDYSGACNMGELQLLLEETLMIRRLKSDVLAQLPPKRREVIILDPKLVNSASKMMKTLAGQMDNQALQGIQKRGALLQYYCATGETKIEAIKNYLADLLETDRKFLCFAHHRIVLDKICDMLTEKNYKHIRIDGSTSSKEKNLLCEVFQVNDSYRVAVLSITSTNMGITLTAAHLVIFAELFWNPGILTQAEDRAHRIGQADSVVVQYLVAANTADDYLWPLVAKKLNVLNKAGLSKDNFRDAETILANLAKQTDMNHYTPDEDDLKFLEGASWDDGDLPMNTDQVPPKKVKM